MSGGQFGDRSGFPFLSLIEGAAALIAPAMAIIALAAQPAGQEPIAPLPRDVRHDPHPAKVDLGRKLFDDRRLSRNQDLSCASCHDLDRGGADGRNRPTGGDGKPLDYNSPTLFNAGVNFRLNWRGNFRSFEDQNESVLLDPRLMHAAWPELLSRLQADPDYLAQFQTLYGDRPARGHVLDALAAFQHSLLTPDARFDRYLRGERDAISAEEERAYQLFKAYGCTACHQGANVGGNLFQKFGVFHNPFAERAAANDADLGRFTLTGMESDRYVFRVPSLRNVAITGPYFHDGSVATLAEAVEIMGRSQLGRNLDARDINLIVQYLGTLTGTYQGHPLGEHPDGARR
jgi:cytochrome c peroxidase